MSSELIAYRVFFASPGGLQEERNAFRDVIEKYNETEAVHRGARFIPVGWELTLGGVGRAQELINEEVRGCDCFVLMLWDRWGSNPEVDGTGKYSSGTEEEYHVAWNSCNDPGLPMQYIVVCFKGVDPRQLRDPGDQLKQVVEFKEELEREKKLMFDTFDALDEFEHKLRAYLGRWLRDHARRAADKAVDPQPPPAPPTTTGIPTEPNSQEPEEKLAKEETELREAEGLADEGKLIEAEATFARAISGGDDPRAFNRYGHFLRRIGRLAQAQVMYESILELTELPDAQRWQAIAFGNLGLIHRTRGDLDQAEAMHRKALRISDRIGLLEGSGAAIGNLGSIYQRRGDLDQAEAMFRRSLEINEELGRREGMAIQYGNLGLVYRTRGDLDQSEAMHRRALDINEKIPWVEGMASDYSSLALVCSKRGNLDEAERLHREGLAIEEKLGHREGMARQYCNLGGIHLRRGDIDQSEEMYRKALEISYKLGLLEGMAIQYGNLGSIYQTRGDLKEARALWTRARDLFEHIGIPRELAKMQDWLDKLPQESPEQ